MHGVHFPVNWQITWLGLQQGNSSLFHYAYVCGFNGTGRGNVAAAFRSQKADDRSRYYVGTWLVCNRNGRKYYYAVCSFGILAGCASGFGYNPGVVTAVSWFPDKKGFASGMAVGTCGMASLIVAPLANFLLTRFNVMTAFRLVGGMFLVVSLATSWYIDGPPAGWKPEGYTPAAAQAAREGKTWREMLKDPRCYLLWATLLCASVAGLMLIGHASRIGQEVAGITAAQAALLVGIMAVANFVGRLALGSLSDVLGRHKVVIGVMLLCALDMVFLSSVSTFPAFVAAIVITGVCFGGTLATFSALSSDTFGAKYNGINYSIIFTGYGIASIVGPNVATAIKSSTGNYSGAFIFAAVCSILAAALCFGAKQLNKKMG